ncbi:MAG: response regulator [Sulfuricellaceae bacterium]|nr:response regulator [Sulfuricellaceae bacterium]
MIYVFVADGSESVREALRELIAEMDGVELAGMARDASGAISGYLKQARKRVPPQVLILDIQLDDGSGLGVLKFIRNRFSATKIIALCDCGSVVYQERCISQGADYFFDKTTEFHRVQDVLCGLTRVGDFPNFGVAA